MRRDFKLFGIDGEHLEQAEAVMAAKAHPLRDAAIATIRNLAAFNGAEEGERLARVKYKDVPKGTFSGWVKLARLPPESPSAPARPARAIASIKDGDPMTFEQRIALIDRHVEMIVAASTREVIEEASGERKTVAKIPTMLAQAVRLQKSAAELLVKYAATVCNIEKIEELYAVVIEEVGKASPEVKSAILARLRTADVRRDIARFGLGLGAVPTNAPLARALPDVDF